MIKRISLLIAVALMAVMMMVATAAPAFAAPKACTPGALGCDTETTNKKDAGASPGFNETETQRGQTTAPGTEPGTTTCTGPSGKPLSPDHPQCD